MFRTICKHLGSLKLALLLLAVIIIASGVGTWLESKVSAEVARHYIYGNIWFDCWLALLVINLFCAAAVRYPWKPHQTGFVITHAGIITLLIGGVIDRHWGIEGFMGLNRGFPATNVMALRKDQLIIATDDAPQSTSNPFIANELKAMASPADRVFPVKSPSPNVKIEVLDVQNVRTVREVVASPNGKPAIHLVRRGSMMGVQERWLMLGDAENEGPATISFVAGMPPALTPKPEESKDGMLPRRERYYVFAKSEADNVMLHEHVGDETKAKVKLSINQKGDDGTLKLNVFDKEFSIPIKENLQKDFPLPGLPEWKVAILGYYPNFRMGENSKPESINDKPENPALHFDLIGPLVKAEKATANNPHGGSEMNPAAGSNALDFYLGQDGKLRYFWKSRTKGEFTGEIEKGKAVPMYAPPGAEFLIDQMLPHAEPRLAYAPLPPDTFTAADEGRTGVHCRITAGGETKELWVGWMDLTGVLTKQTPAGETLDLPEQKWEHIEVGGRKIDLAVINEYRILPFTVSLLKFYAPHPEGEEDMNAFSAFESTLAFNDHKDVVQLKPDAKLLKEQGINDQNPEPLWGAIIDENETSLTMEFEDRQQVTIPRSDILHYTKKTHKIYMNYPTTFPETWYGPWLGTNYKFSQAGHDLPNNPDYSNVQVLRDPGWMPKWVGCLMICFGIFTMFYLKPYFNRRPAVAVATETQKKAPSKEKVAETAAVRSES